MSWSASSAKRFRKFNGEWLPSRLCKQHRRRLSRSLRNLVTIRYLMVYSGIVHGRFGALLRSSFHRLYLRSNRYWLTVSNRVRLHRESTAEA